MRSIRNLLLEKKTLVSDGAWGTIMMKHGLKAGECPELLNIEKPGIIRNIASQYVESGSDIIKTNSFGASRIKLESYGLEGKTIEINKRAASLSKEAAGDKVLVAASIGPSGKILMMGEIEEQVLEDAFSEQAAALEEGGADMILLETFSDLPEAIIAVRAVKASTKLEVLCTMSFDTGSDNLFYTMMGVSPGTMALELPGAGADIIGANCGRGIEDMHGIVKEIRITAPELPIIIHPNAGIPYYSDGKTIYPDSPSHMASQVPGLIEAGCNIIGGCCGTGPEHIRAIVEAIR